MTPFFVVGGVCIIFAVPLFLLSSKVPCKHLLYMHSDQPYVSYHGKFLRRKMYTSFVVFEPPTKVFSTKFGRAIPSMIGFSIHENFLHEIVVSY